MSFNKKIIIGARGSRLSLAYANYAKKLIIQKNQLNANEVDIKIIKTRGDIFPKTPLSQLGGKGVFCKEIENELINKNIDIAVHSLKDLPTIQTPNLKIQSFIERNDPRDSFLSLDKQIFTKQKKGSRIGTSSVRRKLQLLNLKNDLEVLAMRGNIDTRIEKLKSKQYDGIVLAYSGLMMLGLENHVTEIFPTETILPAVGQGIIALQCRENDKNIISLIDRVSHKETFICALAERSFLESIGGDCDTAVGGYARIEGEKIKLEAELFSDDYKKVFKSSKTLHIEESQILGNSVGNDLLKQAGNNYKKKF
tara:strand:- start:1134 stop:2063 length:930 start_codon:yes stop_codon:yes gene_type:complete